MALTKAQISLVTVSTLGVAAGGYEAQLAAFNTQKEAAAFIATTGLLDVGTNAEFALQVAKNLGVSAGDTQVNAFFKALENGASRADATVDFANAQLVAQGGKIANVDVAAASNSTSTDLGELKAIVSNQAVKAGTTIVFEDGHRTSVQLPSTPNTPNDVGDALATKQTIANIGKDQYVNGQATKISNDFTFKLKDQIGEEDTFTGKFLSPMLDRAESESSDSTLYVRLLDGFAERDGAGPIERLPTNGFGFSLDGANIEVISDAIHAAKTYVELNAAIEARLAELGRGENLPEGADATIYSNLANFTVELGSDFTRTNQDNKQVTGTEIIVRDTAGSLLVAQGFSKKAGIQVGTDFNIIEQLTTQAPAVITQAITTNLEADNVGYGSQGASVNITGQSASDKGVEALKVVATNNTWFTKLESKAATTHLKSIELVSGSNGYFNVGTQKGAAVVDLKDQEFAKFDTKGKLTETMAGLVDVIKVDAGLASSTAINAFVSKNVIDRDYKLSDTGAVASDDVNLSYNLSGGNDVFNLAVDQNVMAATDTKVNITTGNGDDLITFQVVKGTNSDGTVKTTTDTKTWLANQQLLNNLTVNAGDGNDHIIMTGAGNATILAGSGNDVVRADNSGSQIEDKGLAVFLFNNAGNTNINTLSNSDNALSAGANGVKQSYDLYKAVVKVSFLGFDSASILIDSTDGKTSTLQINQAIKKAIAESPQLSKLLYAHDNAGNALGIESLVDGKLNLDDLNITITAPKPYDKDETSDTKKAREATGQQMLDANDKAVIDSNAANILNNEVYNADFATDKKDINNTVVKADQLQVQSIDFKGISSLPANHPLSSDTGAKLEIKIGTSTVDVKITKGMTSSDIAKAAAKAISQEFALTATNKLVKAEAFRDKVKVSFDDAATQLEVNIAGVTAGTTSLSTKTLPTTVVGTAGALSGDLAKDATAGSAVLEFASANFTSTAADGAGSVWFEVSGYKSFEIKLTQGLGNLGIAKAVSEQLNGKSLTPTAAASNDTLKMTTTLVDGKVTVSLVGNTKPTTISTSSVSVTATQPDATTTAPVGFTTVSTATTASSYVPATKVATDVTRSTTLEFAGLQVTEEGSIIIGGVTVGLKVGDNGSAIAKKVAAELSKKAIDGSTVQEITELTGNETSVTVIQEVKKDATIKSLPELTITGITAGFANTSADPVVSIEQNYISNGIDKVINGENSIAESDNIINLGSGDDVVMMGTGKDSNDTLVLTGYNQGRNTIVHYDSDVNSAGKDYLDFSIYKAGKVVLGEVNTASGTLTSNTVSKASVSAKDFAKLTNSEVLAQLNDNENKLTGDKKIAGLSLDAASNLKDSDGKDIAGSYVLMVENADNSGEYKVFHLESATGDNKGIFNNAQEIAILDFGQATTASKTPVNVTATLSTSATTGVQTLNYTNKLGDNDIVKGLALTITGSPTLTKAIADQLSELALTDLTLRFTGTGQTVALDTGASLSATNLTVWGGTFDVSKSNLGKFDSVVVNSTLKVSVAQAKAFASNGTKISSSTTGSGIEVIVTTPAEAAELNAVLATLKGNFDTVAAIEVSGAAKGAVDDAKLDAIGGTVAANTVHVAQGNLSSDASIYANKTVSITSGNVVQADFAKLAEAKAVVLNGTTTTLTATAAEFNTFGKAVSGTGKVTLTAATVAELTTANSKLAAGLEVTATLAALTAAANASVLTNIDILNVASIGDTHALTVTAAQAKALAGATETAKFIVTGAVQADLADVITKTAAGSTSTNDTITGTGDFTIAATELAKLQTLTTDSKITVTAVAATAGADVIAIANKLTAATGVENKIITATGEITLTGAQSVTLADAATLAGAGTTVITVGTGEAAAVGTALKDVFNLAAADTATLAITGFTVADDAIKGFGAGATATSATVGTTALSTTSGITVFTAGTVTNVATDATAAAIILEAQTGSGVTDTADGKAYFAFANGTATTIFKYVGISGTHDSEFHESELTLVGTVTSDAVLTIADFTAQ